MRFFNDNTALLASWEKDGFRFAVLYNVTSPSDVGRCLAHNYQDPENVDILLSGGHLNKLNADPDKLVHRGRPETALGLEALLHRALEHRASYLYVYSPREGTWRYAPTAPNFEPINSYYPFHRGAFET